MLRLFTGSLILWSALVLGQGTPSTLLWRVTGPNATGASYLYGTIHSRDDRAFQFGDSVLPALDRCRVVAGELDLDHAVKDLAGLMAHMTLPGDQRLLDLYRPKDRKVVEKALNDRFGPMAAMLQRMKPFYVMALLSEGDAGDGRERMLDDHLMERGRTNGQRVIGLETMEEQLNAMDAIPVKDQAAMLLDQVKRSSDGRQLDDMLNAYAAQDLDKLYAAMGDGEEIPEALVKALFTDRNERMAHRLDSLIRSGETVFFLMGAGHLPRDRGLVALLRARGYQVEPVFSVAHRREEETAPQRD